MKKWVVVLIAIIVILGLVGIGMFVKTHLLTSVSSSESSEGKFVSEGTLLNGSNLQGVDATLDEGVGNVVTGGVITGGAITVDEGNGIFTRFWRWVTGGEDEE